MPKIQGFKKLAFWPVLSFFLLLDSRALRPSIVFSANKKPNQDEHIFFQRMTCKGYILPHPLFLDLRNKSLKKWRQECFN